MGQHQTNSEQVSQQSWSKYSLPSNPPQAQTYSQPKILIFKIENLTIWAEILIKEKKSTLTPVKWEAARAELQTLKEKLKQFSIISPQTMEEEDPVHDSRGQRGASWPRYNKKKNTSPYLPRSSMRNSQQSVSKLNTAMRRKTSAPEAGPSPGTEAWLGILKPVSVTHIARLKKRNHGVFLQVTPRSLWKNPH